MGDDELHAVFDRWNTAELNGYLMEITARIFLDVDEKTGRRLIDLILDEAKQKGTGEWTSQDAMRLQVPVPTIDMAVAMRNLSALKGERVAASKLLNGPAPVLGKERGDFLERLRDALYAAMIITYAQGMAQLRTASLTHGYHLALEEVARIWRGGCIIRAALLEKIRDAFRVQPDLANLLIDPSLGMEIEKRQEALREVVGAAAEAGIPTPGLMVSLAYFDGYRSAWLPANLVQAQRDYFGAHTYERVDAEGAFHTEWDRGLRRSTMEPSIHPEPAVVVIFGAAGDLTWRKLVPALYNLFLDKWLPDRFAVVGVDRKEMSIDEFRQRLREGVDTFSRRGKDRRRDVGRLRLPPGSLHLGGVR